MRAERLPFSRTASPSRSQSRRKAAQSAWPEKFFKVIPEREPVASVMLPAFPFVDASTPVDLLSRMITVENPAVLVREFATEKTFIITRSDLLRML